MMAHSAQPYATAGRAGGKTRYTRHGTGKPVRPGHFAHYYKNCGTGPVYGARPPYTVNACSHCGEFMRSACGRPGSSHAESRFRQWHAVSVSLCSSAGTPRNGHARCTSTSTPPTAIKTPSSSASWPPGPDSSTSVSLRRRPGTSSPIQKATSSACSSAASTHSDSPGPSDRRCRRSAAASKTWGPPSGTGGQLRSSQFIDKVRDVAGLHMAPPEQMATAPSPIPPGRGGSHRAAEPGRFRVLHAA